MLSEAKDTSELMIDLGYAAVYFSDVAMAEEVYQLESRLSDLVHEMRAVCVLAARSPRDADAMASVLQVVGAIERLGNAAVDIGREEAFGERSRLRNAPGAPVVVRGRREIGGERDTGDPVGERDRDHLPVVLVRICAFDAGSVLGRGIVRRFAVLRFERVE